MSIRDRIQQRLDALSITARAASLKAGLNTHFLQKYLSNDQHSMKVENLKILALALDTTAEWLLSGVGDEVAKTDPELQKVIDVWDYIPNARQKYIAETAHAMREKKKAKFEGE